MAVSLQQLLPPLTPDQVKALLISALQGIGPIEQIGQGAGTVVVSGTPAAAYDAILLIGTGGLPGAATFSYSLDSVNYAGPYSIPANGTYVAVGTGLTFQFAGTFNAGDEFIFTTIFPPFPVTDWQEGGIGRTFLESEAATLADLVGNAIPAVTGGGFVDYASGTGAPNDWLSLLSSEVYNNTRFSPAIAQGIVTLALAAGASSQTFAPGTMLVANTTGAGQLIYTNIGAFTLTTANSPLQVPVVAQNSGSAYNLTSNAITTLLTPRTGMTVTSPPTGNSPVTPSPGATGVVSFAGAPTGGANYNFAVRITAGGPIGTGAFQVSLDGTNYSSPLTIPIGGTYAVPVLNGSTPTGITLNFSGTFTAGNSYTFTSYGNWLTKAGQDIESDSALRGRDKSKWTTLGVGAGTSPTFDYLARSTPNGGSEVLKTFSQPDTLIGGQIDMTIAGANGPVSTTALTNIQAYLSARAALCSKIVVTNASNYTVPITGTVYVSAALLVNAQNAIKTALSALQLSIPIGGTLYANQIVAAIEDQQSSGVRNVNLTSPAPNSTIAIPATQVAQLPFTGLTYVLI